MSSPLSVSTLNTPFNSQYLSFNLLSLPYNFLNEPDMGRGAKNNVVDRKENNE